VLLLARSLCAREHNRIYFGPEEERGKVKVFRALVENEKRQCHESTIFLKQTV
jgi:hypothetical protein